MIVFAVHMFVVNKIYFLKNLTFIQQECI